MKTYRLVIILLLFATGLSAQADYMQRVEFDEKILPAYRIRIDENRDIVAEYWEEYWKDQYEVDLDREDRNRERVVYLAEAAETPKLADRKVDVYSKITSMGENASEISLGLGFGYEVFANQVDNPREMETLRTAINRFEAHFYRTYYGELLSEAREELQDVEEDRTDMQEDIDKEEKRRDKWRDKITKLERKIQDSLDEQSDIRESIREKVEVIEERQRKVNALEAKLRPWTQR